jgi:hypothetical protein
MAGISSGLGTLIPNTSDYPEALTLDSSERAKFLAEKSTSGQQAREAARREDARKADAPKNGQERGVKSAENAFSPVVSDLGKNVSVDI